MYNKHNKIKIIKTHKNNVISNKIANVNDKDYMILSNYITPCKKGANNTEEDIFIKSDINTKNYNYNFQKEELKIKTKKYKHKHKKIKQHNNKINIIKRCKKKFISILSRW